LSCGVKIHFFDAYLKLPSTYTATSEQLKTGGNLSEMALDWNYIVSLAF